MSKIKNCLHCSKQMECNRPDKKYCSGSCRSASCQMRKRFSEELMRQSPYNLGQV